ncbi:ankyrin repeat domain-containing protein [Sedimenticola sp.]|uniref:ankyrin repeat domain-containing protein n=1 Tax=Sedimenticola sp. TaxID=1940285 RepID=UPI003D0C1B34
MTRNAVSIAFLSTFLFLSGCALMSEHEFTKIYAEPYAPYDNALLKLDQHIKSNHLTREEASAAWFGALYSRVHSAEPKTVEYLIDNVGVNVIIPYLGAATGAVSGMTPLMLACTNENNSAEIFEMLIKAGADINARFYFRDGIGAYQYKTRMNGSTPLHFCSGEVQAIRFDDISNNKGRNMAGSRVLIKYGADPYAKNDQGRTSMDSEAMAKMNIEKKLAEKRAESQGGLELGQALAIAGGAAIAGSSNLSSAQKAEFMTNYTADVMNNTGGTNTRNWGNQQSQRMSALGQEQGNTSNSGSLSMSCNSPQTSMCGEYTFQSSSDRNNFVSQCRAGGGSILSGKCSPGPSCYHNDNGRTVTTYVYGVSPASVRDNCQREGGTFKN